MGIVSCREEPKEAGEMLANERQIRSVGLGLPGYQATFGFGPAQWSLSSLFLQQL